MKNRMLYHMLRRMGQGLLWFLGGALLVAALLALAQLSAYLFNTPIPALGLFLVVLLCNMAYLMAREDVAQEARERERVLDRLRKE